MIPILSVTTCNSIEFYTDFNNSINYPINTLSVLVNNSNIDYFDQIRNVPKSSFVKKYEYSYCPRNMGCASSWNYHIKHHPQENYWILCSDDVILGQTELSQIDELMMSGCDAVFPDKPSKYILFALNKNTIRNVGLFDENFHPGGFEDNDYENRLSLCSELKIKNYKTECVHNKIVVGSGDNGNGTFSGFNEDQKSKWNECCSLNKKYFHSKWDKFDKPPHYWIFDIDERSKKELII
jgi:hypothetical protein